MENTKVILQELESKYINIGYYFSIVEVIETRINSTPDIAIEACKSLIEGISKFILKQLDEAIDMRTVEGMDFKPLFKRSMTVLATKCTDVEEDFINRSQSLIHILGEIRNRRGDISHGKLAPKEFNSSNLFSNLVVQMTDGLVSYILKCFASINDEDELKYENNEVFNDWLDRENNFGNLSYSKALFSQDIEAYRQELLAFEDMNLNTDNE